MMFLVGYMGAPPTIGSPAASPRCGSVMAAAAPIRAAAMVLTITVRLMASLVWLHRSHAGIVEVTEATGDGFCLIRSQNLERENKAREYHRCDQCWKPLDVPSVQCRRQRTYATRQSLSQSVRSRTASWPGQGASLILFQLSLAMLRI